MTSQQQRINLQDFTVSLLQSQRIVDSQVLRNEANKDKLIISTEIVQLPSAAAAAAATTSSNQNMFEIKFIVDSPFGSIQIANSIFISAAAAATQSSQASITRLANVSTGHSTETSLAEIFFAQPSSSPTPVALSQDQNQSNAMQSAKKLPAQQSKRTINKTQNQSKPHSTTKSTSATTIPATSSSIRQRKASRAESTSSATFPTAPSSLNQIDQEDEELNNLLTSFASSSSSSAHQNCATSLSTQTTTTSISCFNDEEDIQQQQQHEQQNKNSATGFSTDSTTAASNLIEDDDDDEEEEEQDMCSSTNNAQLIQQQQQQQQQQLQLENNDTLMNEMEQERECEDNENNNACGADTDQSLEELSEISLEFMRCEKKNSVKNVLKAFGNYLHALEDSIDGDLLQRAGFKSSVDLRKRYSRYNKNQSYNNSLVSKIITHPQYGLLFSVFVNSVAIGWLHSSDVADKQSHSIFIEFCKHACINHAHLNCLKIIKKKHLKLSTS